MKVVKTVVEIPDSEALEAFERASKDRRGKTGFIVVKIKTEITEAIMQLCRMLLRPLESFKRLGKYLEEIFSNTRLKYGVAILFSRRES